MALKNSKMLRWCVATAAISSLLLLSACGDDSSSTKGSEPAEGADIIKATFDDLPVCTDKREGAIAYVKDEKTAYTCTGGNWTQETPDAVPTSLDGVNGFSQKGPFIKGSSVKVLELESGRTLKQTGRNFDTKIQTDDGHFALNASTMVSQYVELHADGFYKNEVTGESSNAPLTLYALTDVMMREGGKVNINLLTHLEYQRVLHLVQKQNMTVAAAKNQAQKEIFAILNIDSKGFGNSEDLSIVGTTDADAALLAFSILFQGDRSVADLTELLQSVVSDLEDDGEWNDVVTKAKIADWASAKDLSGGLSTIRANVEKWNLGSVPNFEKYVRNFWYTNYGLGECGTNNKGEIKATANEHSATYGTQTRYVCKDGVWVEAYFNTTITYGTLTETAERGGQTYRTMSIGEGENAQIWMAENLNYYDETLDGRSWCYGAENSATTPKCAVTGRFYTWAAAVGKSEDECGYGNSCNLGEGKVQGICPDGWHLPSNDEWNTLFTNVGGWNDAGKILKSQMYGGNGMDTFGFSALMAGHREDRDRMNYEDEYYSAYFWSSTENDSHSAYNVVLYHSDDGAMLDTLLPKGEGEGLSVRCLKD